MQTIKTKINRALVLSGGGARGNFQRRAIHYLHEQGIQFDYVVGASVGAMNGAMVAQHKYSQLQHIWDNITDGQVFTGKVNKWNLIKAALLGRSGVLGSDPMVDMIRKYVHMHHFKSMFECAAVNEETGEVRYFGNYPDTTTRILQNAISASAHMTVVWPGVDIFETPSSKAVWSDGGARDNSPLGEAVQMNPDEIYIINCHNRDISVEQDLGTVVKRFGRFVEISLNETMNRDLSEFLRINELVKQAEAQGATLLKKDGTPYKAFKHVIIEPEEPLGSPLDFDGSRSYAHLGYSAARRALAASELAPER